MASIFCAWRSCCSRARCSVTSSAISSKKGLTFRPRMVHPERRTMMTFRLWHNQSTTSSSKRFPERR